VGYGHGLADKPEIVGLNKIDAIDPSEIEKKRRALARAVRRGTAVLPLSGVSGVGLPELLGTLAKTIETAREQSAVHIGRRIMSCGGVEKGAAFETPAPQDEAGS